MSDVPSELYQKILVQLPAKSLFRLRSVCKAWLGIIDDTSFIKAHTNNQVYSHTLLVRNETGAPLFSFSLDSLNFAKDLQSIDATKIKQLIRHGVRRLPTLSYVASCNGLLLLSHEDDRYIWAIWNPLTGDCHELPRPNAAPRFDLSGFGFGYDSESDDYKVVKLDRLFSAGNMVYRTLVYSLKSDSWNRIEDCPDFTSFLEPAVFLNDTLYWLSRDVIIALDIRTESYSQLPLPPVAIRSKDSGFDMHIRYHLDAWDGCLIFSLNYHYMRLFDGWVMKDNGVEKSWIKLFSLQLSDFLYDDAMNYKLVAYLKGKQQVVLQCSRGFTWFDIENNSIMYFSVHGFPRIASSTICPGSLVRLRTRGFEVTARRTSTKKRKRSSKKTDSSLKICVRHEEDECCFNDRICSEDLCDCNIAKLMCWEDEA